ncbi:MAG: AAA family ATPase, partial [Romboutsia sp.]|nr:AAA family ATPase [Romboutsia sp.]
MRIILIGFMGVGKTTIGKIIAKKLKLNFVDMDNYIEKREGKSISKIFEAYGEQHFRKLESESLKDLIKSDNIVISTGGGIVTTKENS